MSGEILRAEETGPCPTILDVSVKRTLMARMVISEPHPSFLALVFSVEAATTKAGAAHNYLNEIKVCERICPDCAAQQQLSANVEMRPLRACILTMMEDQDRARWFDFG